MQSFNDLLFWHENIFNVDLLKQIYLTKLIDDARKTKVGKVLTARENPGEKTRVFPGWAILPEIAVLGNTG